jgi:ribosomal protein S18 acetylase RimI-like enzyme
MVTIRPANDADLPAVRRLMRDYAAWVNLDLSFQDFEGELRALPGDYAPPNGALLVAEVGADTVAMIALRPLADGVSEMKRLFVHPSARGLGVGRALITRVMQEARAIGYREMRLDTLPAMGEAQAIYEAFGFRDVEAYYETPIAGTRFMSVTL